MDTELDDLLAGITAIALDGPKAVGKTATARRRAATVINLDDDVRRATLAADPNQIATARPPVFIDEWQRLPPVWDAVRRAVDDGPRPGRFLLAGSASPPPGAAIHSGAGRIISLRMRPMALSERGIPRTRPSVSLADLLRGGRPAVSGATPVSLTGYVEEILASGFPGIRALPGRYRGPQLDGYLQRITDREIPMLGVEVRRPLTLRRWMTAYAAATSTTTTHQRLLSAVGGDGEPMAKTTAISYRETLTRLWLLDPVEAWSPSLNPLARLTLAPKHHLADPALAARLLGATAESLLDAQTGLTGGPLLGALFESLVTLSIRTLAQSAGARTYHLRTRGGEHEIDLILERDDHRVLAIETKLGGAVNEADTRHLRWLADQLGPRLLDQVVVTTGPDAYRRRDGVAVVPLALLGP